MNKFFFIGLFIFASVHYAGAQVSPPSNQNLPASVTIPAPNQRAPMTNPNPNQQAPMTRQAPATPRTQTPANPAKPASALYAPVSNLPYFLDPGIIGYSNGKWIGTDHLYNLTDELGVIVEVVRMPGAEPLLDEKIMEANVLDLFKKAGMRPFPLTGDPTPPLPFYHVLVITMPIPNGRIGYVSCRLFESVELARVQLAEGIFFQANTWEDQTLVQTATNDFAPHIYNDIKQITEKFIERFKHFQEMRNRFGR